MNFKPYGQTARWKEIEKTMPGGLAPQALKFAWPYATYFADRFFHGEAAGAKLDPNETVLR